MSRELIPYEEEDNEQEAKPVNERLLPFACAAATGGVLSTSVGLALLINPHLGAGLWFIDFAATVIAYIFGPDLLSIKRPSLPQYERPRIPGERSLGDRLIGRFPDGVAPVEVVSDDVISFPDDEKAHEAIEAAMEEYKQRIPTPQPEARDSKSSGELRRIVYVRAHDLAREVVLSSSLGLDIDEIIEAGVFVAGMKGSGKSSLAARLMEQVGRFPLPQIIYDIKGDFVSLTDSHFKRGVLMTSGQEFDVSSIISDHLQVIIDLRSWETMDERANVIASLNQSLLRYAMSLPEEMRIPWFVHLDEAQQVVPQQQPVGIEPATWKAVTQSVTNLGVLGRAYGAVPCLYTQRIASIHKDVVSQQDLRVFMKASLDNDLKRYEEYINRDVARREDIQAFRAGDAVVLLPDGRQFIVHFLPRESKHGSHTPHLEQALRSRPHREQVAYMPASWGKPSLPAMETMRKYETVLALQSAQIKPQLPDMTELQKLAYEQWKQGIRGQRPLMRALGITYYQAGQLVDQLEDWQKKGVID